MDDAPYVTAVHVKQAIEERYYRSALIIEKSQEMIAKNTLLIDVTGVEVGQVNGLSVISLGDIAFGRPSRITASVSLGQEGLIDIEREAELIFVRSGLTPRVIEGPEALESSVSALWRRGANPGS